MLLILIAKCNRCGFWLNRSANGFLSAFSCSRLVSKVVGIGVSKLHTQYEASCPFRAAFSLPRMCERHCWKLASCGRATSPKTCRLNRSILLKICRGLGHDADRPSLERGVIGRRKADVPKVRCGFRELNTNFGYVVGLPN